MTGIGAGMAFFAGAGLGTTGVLLVAAIAGFIWTSGSVRLIVAASALALSLVGAWRAPEPSGLRTVLDLKEDVNLVATVDSLPVTTLAGQRFEIQVDADSDFTDSRFCVDSESGIQVDNGSQVRLTGSVIPVTDLPLGLQGALNAKACDALLQTSEIVVLREPSAVQSLVNAIRNRISTVFQRAAPGDAGALMTGLATGDDNALSFDAQSAFLATGTTHITAVSGSNFALIVLIATVASGGTGARRRLPWITITASAIWLYAILVGLPPSALRAALMATFALIAVRFGRRPDFVTLLVVCGALQVVLRPEDLHSLSFQLSFVATLALVLVFSGRDFKFRQLPVTIVLTAFAAYLATVPVLAYRLGEIAPATIPANILISPLTLIGFSMALAAAVLALLSQTAGVAAAIPAGVVSEGIVAIVENASRLLPGRTSTGAASNASLLTLTLLCWSVVIGLSPDARTAIARGWQGLTASTSPTRLGLIAVPLIALVVYASITMAR